MRRLFFLFLTMPFFLHAQQVSPSKKINELRSVIPSLMKQGNIPGLSIVLIYDGEIAWSQAFGYAQAVTKTSLTSRHIFEAGALGQPLFAFMILRLAELGRLNLEQPISAFYPVKISSDTVRQKRITALHCLSHTTGLPSHQPKTGTMKFYFTPGEKFSYSLEGLRYLQQAVEHKEGKSINELATELVFEPLKMTSSSFTWRPAYETLKVHPHNFLGTVTEREKPTEPHAGLTLHTTAMDFAKFAQAILSQELLEEDTYKKMLSAFVTVEEDCVECPHRGKRALSKDVAWGLGVGLQSAAGTKTFWQWADNGNAQAFMVGNPESGDGLVVFANSANLLSITAKLAYSALEIEVPALAWLQIVPYNRAERLALNTILAGTKVDRKTVGHLTNNQLNWLALTLIRADKNKEAIEVLKTGIDSTALSDSYYALSLAYLMSGNYESAKIYSRKSVALSARNTLAFDLLQKLEDETRIIDPALLRQYAGKYDTPYGVASITLSEGKLYLKMADYPLERLMAKNENSFIAEGYGMTLSFEKENGRVRGFSFTIGNEKNTAVRIPE